MPQPRKRKTRRDDLEANNSGVDMAFDALMNLEENGDLAAFMRSYMKRDINCELFGPGQDGREDLSM